MITTENTVNEAMVEKIKGLLRLASSSNQHEAELAMSRAQALAVKHDLDIASMNAWEEKQTEEKIEKSENLTDGTKRQSIVQKYITWILQDNFNVKIIYHTSRYFGFRMTIVGTKSNIQIATYVNEYLKRTMMQLWHDYQEKNNLDCSARNSFQYGVYTGLKNKLADARREEENNKFNSIPAENLNDFKNKYALVLTSHREKLENAMNNFYPELRRSSSKLTGINRNQQALTDGISAGKSINLRSGIAAASGKLLN